MQMMETPFALVQFGVQFGVSLLAIVLLAALAYGLKLGPAPKLATGQDVANAAREAVDGFVAQEWAASSDGSAALAKDKDGRLMLLKLHGNRFAGRLLGAAASAQLSDARSSDVGHSGATAIEVTSGERQFGSVILLIENPETWAEAVNALRHKHNA